MTDEKIEEVLQFALSIQRDIRQAEEKLNQIKIKINQIII